MPRNEVHVFHWAVAPNLNEQDGRTVRFDMSFRVKLEQVQEMVRKGWVVFKKVAILKNSGNLDLAWERTNTIHGPWYEDNLGVYPDGHELVKTVDGGVRSSMVGDILVHVTDEVIRGYITASFGFAALPSIDLFGIEI